MLKMSAYVAATYPPIFTPGLSNGNRVSTLSGPTYEKVQDFYPLLHGGIGISTRPTSFIQPLSSFRVIPPPCVVIWIKVVFVSFI